MPMTVPTMPITSPFSMKMRVTAWPVAPIAFRMAISRCFSTTIMVSVLTMLKEATITTSTSRMNIMNFSSLSAENRFLLSFIQSRAQEGAQPQRQLLADDDAGEPRRGRGRLVRLQVLQLAGAEVLRDLRDRRFAPHIDTAQHDAVRAALRREQHLLEDERGGGNHLRDGGHFVRQRGVVLDGLAGPRGDDDVRVGAEDRGLQVFLEARHDAQCGYQRR